MNDRLPEMTSYAQNFEDVLLRRAFLGQQSGFYIDVGAADPINDSVTCWFYEQGWSGVNIEPNRTFYQRLATHRKRDFNILAGVGRMREQRTYFQAENGGLSTFKEEIALKTDCPILSVEMEVRTLKDICEDLQLPTIDFLKIDVEGWEEEVIAGADLEKFPPRIILVESTEPNTTTQVHHRWEHLLFGADYSFCFFDGLNRYYARRDQPDLIDRLRIPANYFDNFVLSRERVWQVECDKRLRDLVAVTQMNERLQSQLDECEKSSQERLADVNSLTKLIKRLQSDLSECQKDREKRLDDVLTLTSEVHRLQKGRRES